MSSSKEQANKRYDLVLFGATGVTGKYAIKEIVKAKQANAKLTWAVAGRDQKKLKQALTECGCDASAIPTIVADIKNKTSIQNMCKQAKVVINTVGPYQLYGEIVVESCVEQGTHHLDVSGEPLFLERMQLNYHDKAQEAGVYVIGACGFDSIPADMGIEFLKQKFDGDLNTAETYLNTKAGPSGYKVGLGTWNSLIHGISSSGKLRAMRKALCTKIFPESLPKSSFKLKSKGMLFNSNVVKGWCAIFPGSDRSIANRTQLHNYKLFKSRPVQVQTYFKLPSLMYGIIMAMLAAVFGLMTKVGFGRYLLKSYPGFFSIGFFNKDGPSEIQVKEASFQMTIVGEGWAEKLPPNEDHPQPPNKKMVVQVNGPDAGYITTCMAIVSCGLVLLGETDKMPANGGVYTTATAFGKTSLFEKLNKGGLKMEIQN